MGGDLFSRAKRDVVASGAGSSVEPLASRMRPRTLDEFWGQSHILAKGRLLRRAIEADRLSSVIFYGPPGTGKTTLARIIANTTSSKFLSINAVLSGVKEIRDAIESARQNYGLVGRRSILFVDEVHRFNRSQQDALLPWVENGTITLIGATTENPYFEVNKALVSRSRVFQLMPLSDDDLRHIANQAIQDDTRGYGALPVLMHADALDHLVGVANGDARALLNALELAVITTPINADNMIEITLEVAEESIQRRAVLYDKEGDAHFDTISAFIKSVRGSDPDAALYWLARMVYAGEAPEFIFRRLLISACEDVGMADPNAVSVVESCARAFERIGMPEGRYHLAHATLYLSTAPKSNSSMAFFDALSVVQSESSYDVPDPLKDPSRDAEGLGHGRGYLYPHAYRDHWVAQQYLPDGLQGRVFYNPTRIGYEASVCDSVARHREEQLTALEDGQVGACSAVSRDLWIGRTFDGGAQRSGFIREGVFGRAGIETNSVVLDINAASGLLSFEALRRCPDGGVYSVVMPSVASDNFASLMEGRDDIERAIICRSDSISGECIGNMFPGVLFDVAIGRNFLSKLTDLDEFFAGLSGVLAQGGRISFAEVLRSADPRIYSLRTPCPKQMDPSLLAAWREAEDEIVGLMGALDVGADAVRWSSSAAGLNLEVSIVDMTGRVTVTGSMFEHWFGTGPAHAPRYMDLLETKLPRESCDRIRSWAATFLKGQTVEWPSKVMFVWGARSPK